MKFRAISLGKLAKFSRCYFFGTPGSCRAVLARLALRQFNAVTAADATFTESRRGPKFICISQVELQFACLPDIFFYSSVIFVYVTGDGGYIYIYNLDIERRYFAQHQVPTIKRPARASECFSIMGHMSDERTYFPGSTFSAMM